MNIVFLSSESSHHFFLINEINKFYGVKKVFFQTIHTECKPLLLRIKRWINPRHFDSIVHGILYRLSFARESAKKVEFERKYFWKGGAPFLDTSIAFEKVRSFNDPSTVERVRKEKPDLIIVFGTEILKGDILKVARINIFNIHRGILPQYRGGGVTTWTLFNNDFENIGATVHVCSESLDGGDVVGQRHYHLQKDDEIYKLRARTTVLAVEILKDIIEKAKNGTLYFEKQKSNSKTWSVKDITFTTELIARRNFSRYIKSLKQFQS